MKKIIYWTLGTLAGIILLIAGAGFLKFNFTNGGDILPDNNQPIKYKDLISIFLSNS